MTVRTILTTPFNTGKKLFYILCSNALHHGHDHTNNTKREIQIRLKKFVLHDQPFCKRQINNS
jgi:hypothetical protein